MRGSHRAAAAAIVLAGWMGAAFALLPAPAAGVGGSDALLANGTGAAQRTARARRARTAKRPDPTAARETAALQEIVRRLADPRMQGRGVGTAGIDSAAAFLATRMQGLGLQPAGDAGSYFQTLEITTGVQVVQPSWIEVAGTRYEAGADFMPYGFSTNGTLRAAVLFAGYGITAPGYFYDDYTPRIDPRNQIVLVFTNEPGEHDWQSRFDGIVNTPHADPRTKAINAREHGALGMLVVNGPRHHHGDPLRPPRRNTGGYMASGILAAQVSERLASRLLSPDGLTLSDMQAQIDAGGGRPMSYDLPESATVTITLERTRASVRNVVGWIRGRDSSRTIVVGAHYDHLGLGGESSLAPDTVAVHPGADDNASGVAVLLEVARRFADRARRRQELPEHNLVFCAFTGEEMGLVGSSHFVDHPPVPLESIETMVNLDMVGRLREGKLVAMGAATSPEFSALLANTNAHFGFDLKPTNDGFGPSDHSSFYKRDIPVLSLFTGAHRDYHKPSDTPEKLEWEGVRRIAHFTAALVESLDARPRPGFQRVKADSIIGVIRGGGGFGAYLGTIPDYTQTEGGVLISDVRPGSPAEQAGIKEGDVILRFDDVRIDNIYDFTFALRTRKPGDKVRITVRRGAARHETTATLGRRS